MDIYSFLCLLTDDSEPIAVFDLSTGEEVFCGEAVDAMAAFGVYDVLSFDLDHHDPRGVLMVLNIETGETED